eukprot:Hpha_TRINITY_DN16030_c1_g6::TRINITY_DN16030_c1_g6_i2::g.120818::m.120818
MDHVPQCAHFLSLMMTRSRTAVRLGAMTGPFMFGNISTGRRRYATVVGSCVELSLVLAEEADIQEVAALAAGAVGEYCESEGSAIGFSLWKEVSGGNFSVWTLEAKSRHEGAAVCWDEVTEQARDGAAVRDGAVGKETPGRVVQYSCGQLPAR